MKHHFFYGKGLNIDQEELAQFKRDTALMAQRGELSDNELKKRAQIIRQYQIDCSNCSD